MAEPLAIISTVTSTILTLVDALELDDQNRKDIYPLMSELKTDIEDFTELRKYQGGVGDDLDRPFTDLIDKLNEFHANCEALLRKHRGRRAKRTLNRGKRLLGETFLELKIMEIREEIRDSKSKYMSIAVSPMRVDKIDTTSASELRAALTSLVMTAVSDPKEARRIFGVDCMTTKQRRAALRHTAIDLAITTKDEQYFLIKSKRHTLEEALDTGAPTLHYNIYKGSPQNHEINSDDPFYDLDCDSSKVWQPHDALIETAAYLDLLRDPESLAATPAIVLFIRADRLCRSLLSLGLSHEALQLCTIARNIIQNLSRSHPEAYEGYLAESLLSLSHCCGGMGHWDGALIAIQESAEKFRGLAKANPAAYDKKLALSLSRLSTCLSHLGRTKEALATVREAVEIIHAVTGRGLYDPGLAASLCCLSNHLLGAKQTTEALNAAEEAVGMHQSLTVRNSDQSLAVGNFDALQLRLTRSLVCLSSCLCSVGETERAIAVSQVSVERCRFLAKANTDSDVFNVNLARCLLALAHCLSAAGIMEDARNATHEAVQLYRSMTKTSPDAYQSHLAGSLFDLCLCLINMGLIEDALDVIKESVKLRRALAKANPDTSKADLAISLVVLAELLADKAKEKEPPRSTRRSMDRLIHMAKADPSLFNIKLFSPTHRVRRTEESTENIAKLESRIDPEFLDDSSGCDGTSEDDAISEAVDLYRDLFKSSPDVIRPALAMSLFSLSFRLRETGRVNVALDAYTEAAGHYRALVKTNPGAYEQDLARCLYSLADCFIQMGKSEAALPVIEESTSGLRALAKTDPETFVPDLANSLEMLSLCLSYTGRDVDTFNVLEEAANIYRPLAKTNLPAYGPCLSRCLHKRYLCLVAVGKTREALDAIQELVIIRRDLTRVNLKEFKSDLLISLDALASCLRHAEEIGNSKELDAIEEPVRHHRSLAKANTEPSDAERAMSLIDSSDRLIGMGKNGRALDAIMEAGPLCRTLVKSNGCSDILYKLADSLDNLFSRFLQAEDNMGALDSMEEAVQIRRVLAEEGSESDRAELASSLGKLSRCLRDAGEDEEALDVMREAVDIQRKLDVKAKMGFPPGRNITVLDGSLKHHI